MTHAELVERAAKWLRNSRNCGVVLTEFHSYAGEIPDAIGFQSSPHKSVLIECKTSVSDFYADAKKPGRRTSHGIGRRRYYLAPLGVLTAELVRKHRPRWGLLEATARNIRATLDAEPFGLETSWRELPLLYAYARRIAQYGFTLDEVQRLVWDEADRRAAAARAGVV